MVVIGIDLGTTNSSVAVFRNGYVDLLPASSYWATPSFVSFYEGKTYVGQHAKQLLGFDPENTIYDAKRVLGKRFSDDTITKDMEDKPFKIIDRGGKPVYEVLHSGGRKIFHPEQITALVLQKVLHVAEMGLDESENITGAVITVPANFNSTQRQATKNAGQIAGLNVLDVLSESTAAAISYGYRNPEANKTIMVYDLGGGTFEVSIVVIKDNEFDVKAVSGDCHLGGGDFDQLLVNYLIADIKKKYKRDISNNKAAVNLLRDHCEIAKRALTNWTATRIVIQQLVRGLDYSTKIKRTVFEKLIGELVNKTIVEVEKVLDEAKLSKDQIDEVVLLGGSTPIPMVRKLLRKFFDGKELDMSNMNKRVVYGAALRGAHLDGVGIPAIAGMVIRDVTPISECSESELCQALASFQVLERNTKIPSSTSVTLASLAEKQTSIRFCIREGEPITEDNDMVKRTFTGSRPRNGRAEIMFEMDENGIYKFHAQDLTSRILNEMTITDARSLSVYQIAQMKLEAERWKREDDMKRDKSAIMVSSIKVCQR